LSEETYNTVCHDRNTRICQRNNLLTLSSIFQPPTIPFFFSKKLDFACSQTTSLCLITYIVVEFHNKMDGAVYICMSSNHFPATDINWGQPPMTAPAASAGTLPEGREIARGTE
jgi:hypothetical protein